LKYLKNIVAFHPIKATDIVTHTGKQIASKAFIHNEHTEIRFFSFAKGESIDKEYYEMETLFFVLEGTLKVVYQETQEVVVQQGEVVALEGGLLYGVEAIENCKVCSILVKS
jgi:quercetin dioxygenase-like cupin family protein